ncbi:MAG: ankyrin repeat domain-containing protein [Opitutus sp.]|nr:ankyrin repeat domain-containing protein [Opitutus sp.]
MGKKANVNAVLSDGSSAVSIAASIDDSTYLEMLLNSGGDPNLFNPLREYSPLFASLEHAKIENIKILLRHGTIVDATDRNGNTVLKSAAVMNQYDVAFELLKAGADPTIKNKVQSIRFGCN